MKICFTADEPKGLESVMSYHFGHCPYYVMVNVEGNEVKNVESIPNPLADEHNVGELPTFMKEKGVDVIVTGGMGPKAQQYFADYGIKPVAGAYGKVKDVLEEYLNSKIEVHEETSIPVEHSQEEGENGDVEKLRKENTDLRRQVADLKSRLLKIEKKLDI